MPFNFQISKSVNVGGQTLSESRTITGDELIARNVSIAKGIAGTVAAAMTSTTSTTTTLPPGGSQSGTLSLSSVSGLAIGNRLDVYWSGGSLYGATIEDIAGTSIFFNGGVVWSGGTAFPSNGTAIQIMVPTELDFTFTGNNLQAIAFASGSGGTFIVDTAVASDAFVVVLPVDTPQATEYHWALGDHIANPLAGISAAKLRISHPNTAAAVTMQAAALITP